MEFVFSINNLIESEISRFDAKLIPYRNGPGSRENKMHLHQVIDEMGEASAKAQGLRGAITSADKMRHTNHILYIMKETEGERGGGAVVGILKVGHKKLFVYDAHGGQHEVEPLCVLDFYVHESRQRKGYGRRIFDFMLQDQCIYAQHLAIDRPSHKFLQFLQKHYHLKATIPQVNNFVVFTGFFHERNKKPPKENVRKAPLFLYRAPISANNGVKTARTEAYTQQHKEALSGVSARQGNGSDASDKPASASSNTSRGDSAHARLAGMQSLYSRHDLNPASPLPDIGQPKTTSASSQRGRTVHAPASVLQNQNAYQDRRGHLKVAASPHNAHPHSASKPHHQNHTQAPTGHTPAHGQQPGHAQNPSKHPSSAHSQQNGRNGPALNGLNAYERQILSDIPATKPTDINLKTQNDQLLPQHFTPYADLNLPPPDPYSRRTLSNRPQDTSWNVFGTLNTRTLPANGYAAPQRFQNTRPW